MIPWSHLDSAQMPDNGGELRLMRRGAEYSIMLGTNELMNSRLSGSEEALATLSCEKIRKPARPHVLIGGLGMGFTLRATLAALHADARITVAELVPAVTEWARGPMADIFDNCLDDQRVTIHQGDVGPLIASGKSDFDAILLDVDNGPEGLTRKANNNIYDANGLLAAHRALRAGGVLAVWSSGPDREFTQRLKRAGFAVDEVKVRARSKNRGARHIIWLAVKK